MSVSRRAVSVALVSAVVLTNQARAQAVWEYPPVDTSVGARGWVATIPLAEDGDPSFLFVRASVGGVERWWLINTGTGTCQISTKLVARSGRQRTLALQVHLAPAVAVPCDGVAPEDMSSWTNDLGRPIGGVLGGALFRRYVIQIDYAAHALRLYDPAVYRYTGRGDTVALRFDGTHPRVAVSIRGDSGAMEVVRMPFLITGSTDGVNDSIVLGAHTTPRYEVVTSNDGIAGRALEGTLASARLGRFVLRDVPSAGDGPGLVGGAALRQFTCIVDYPHARMFLEPNEHFGEAFDRGPRSGLWFYAPSFRPEPTVSSVIPRSPGAQAGIRAGDVIHRLDGHLSSELGAERVERLMNRIGNSYDLVVQRGRHSLRVRLRL